MEVKEYFSKAVETLLYWNNARETNRGLLSVDEADRARRKRDCMG